MARGFDSKDVEYQQAQAEAQHRRSDRPKVTAEERDALARTRTLNLALARARADLAASKSDGHRKMLEHAIAALEGELRRNIEK